jgi:hypothetical protein
MSDFNAVSVINKASEAVLTASPKKDKSSDLNHKDSQSYGSFHDVLHTPEFKISPAKSASQSKKSSTPSSPKEKFDPKKMPPEKSREHSPHSVKTSSKPPAHSAKSEENMVQAGYERAKTEKEECYKNNNSAVNEENNTIEEVQSAQHNETSPLKPRFIWEETEIELVSANRDLKNTLEEEVPHRTKSNDEDAEVDFSSEEEDLYPQNIDHNRPIMSLISNERILHQKESLDNTTQSCDGPELPFLNINTNKMNNHQNEKGLYHVTSSEQTTEFSNDRFSMHNSKDFSKFDVDSKNFSDQFPKDLSAEEQKIIDDFVEHEKILGLKSQAPLNIQKAENSSIRHYSNNDLHIYTEQTKAAPYTGGSISLTPLPMMQQTIIPQDQKLMTGDRSNIETSLEGTLTSVVSSEPVNITADTTGGNQMNFGQHSQARSITQDQTRMIQTTLTQHYVASEFVAQIKDQFQKFQSGQDKKVTVYMRDGRKNLTMIMKMNNANGLDLTFRTSDTAWADVLEKNKNYIEEELNKLNDGHQQIGIYYTGDSQ